MNTHLSAQEFVEALEGTLRHERRAHVSGCEACTREIAQMSAIAGEAQQAGAVPEPSPLFWDHFSARVSAATGAETIRTLSWWERVWKPVVTLSAVAAAAMLTVVIFNARTSRVAPGGSTGADARVAVTEPALDDASLEFMVQMAADSSNEELLSARPGSDATAAVLDDLTPEQQAEFIRLIKAEIGDHQ